MVKKPICIYLLSLLVFCLLSFGGFITGIKVTWNFLLDTLGLVELEVVGMTSLTFQVVGIFAGLLGAIFGLLIALIILHRLGLYLKISVLKPTLFGFLTFLLLLFLYLLYLGR